MIGIVDCNNFYASCERAFNPALNGKPIIVLSNNDGCVIARSNEAKALGIEMGVPAFQIKDFIDKHQVHVFSSNYALYGDMSARVMNVLFESIEEVEIYSIDEAFINLSGYKDVEKLCKKLRDKVYQHTGIPVSIGIAPTKTLAKVANKYAKKHKDYAGVCVIDSSEKIYKALKNYKVADIWGIGRQHTKFLNKNGIDTAWQLSQVNNAWVRKNLSVVGLRMVQELKGIPSIPIELVPPAKKGIGSAKSFGNMTSDYNTIHDAMCHYAASCAVKLRRQNSCVTHISVFLHTNFFREDLPQHSNSRSITLPIATSSTPEILKYCTFALKLIYQEGYQYKKVGVMFMGIVPNNPIQSSLFDEPTSDRSNLLMNVLDKINKSIGRDKLRMAAQGYGRNWKLRQEKLSPRYTTRWDEIITVRCY